MDVAAVLARRLGDAARGKHLAEKYEEGVLAWARKRTAGSGAVPTTIVGERVELLLEISVALKELLTEREIAALFRLTPGTARRLSEELRSMYEDTIQPFISTTRSRAPATSGRATTRVCAVTASRSTPRTTSARS